MNFPKAKPRTSSSLPAPPPAAPTSKHTEVPTVTTVPPAASVPAVDADLGAADSSFHDANNAEQMGVVSSGDSTESEQKADTTETSSTAPLVVSSVMPNSTPIDVDAVARRAVRQVLDDQAELARFDVYSNRVTLTLDDEDLRTYKSAWLERNSTSSEKLTFSSYLVTRLKACRTHTSVRPVYITDEVRQYIEDLFGELVVSGQDLANKIDRHIRPVIESPDNPEGILRLKPLDPTFVEMVTGWFPDKTAADALGDFIHESAMQRAGLG